MLLCTETAEVKQRGWETVDFVLVSGDAYVDHPAFGTAIIGRWLEKHGFKVAVLAQPNWNSTADWQKFGRPNYAFLVTAGNVDSMVNHYSVNKKRRTRDVYSDRGIPGKRPDRATIVYCQCIRKVYHDVAIVIGGLEASLRKLAHYDYWSNKIRQSILIQSSADLLVYGMGERAVLAIAEALAQGQTVSSLTWIKGTVYKTKRLPQGEYCRLPSYQEVSRDKDQYLDSVLLQYANSDAINGRVLVEEYADGWLAVVNPPGEILSEEELDEVYAMPFERSFPTSYTMIPALQEVKFSIVATRGCFGACTFCALTLHQGRSVSSRSEASLVAEAEKITTLEGFKGYIHDVGGPTANFWQPACQRQKTQGLCPNRQCLTPEPCENLEVSHQKLLSALRQIRQLKGVKKVFLRSGLRFDYLLLDNDESFFVELIQHHISGQLKVAPEHCNDAVLRHMGKSKFSVYLAFCERFAALNKQYNKQQYLVPYLISSHPGCGLNEAIELACYLKAVKKTPLQVQDFYPTVGTLATCAYYCEKDPLTKIALYVAKTYHAKQQQRALLQANIPGNYDIVEGALRQAGRSDLIGWRENCLIKPRKPAKKPIAK